MTSRPPGFMAGVAVALALAAVAVAARAYLLARSALRHQADHCLILADLQDLRRLDELCSDPRTAIG